MGDATAIVRAATGEDAAAIALLLQAGSLTPAAEDAESPSRYAAAIERVRAAGGEVLVATIGAEVVGVCQVLLLLHLQHAGGRAAEVESVHVAAELRSRGIGAAMLDACVEWARARGCYRVQLTSNVAREDAHRFYRAQGFVASHVGFKRSLEPPT